MYNTFRLRPGRCICVGRETLMGATDKRPRKLGFLDVFCIASGAMISSGLFVLPGLAFAKAGPAVVFSYALAAVLILPALLCQAELASAIPRHGATFVFIERSLGTFVGTFAGLAGWFAIALKSAFALVGIGAFARLLWPETPGWVIRMVAVGFCLFFTMLNCLTVKGAGRAQVAMVAGLGAVLLWFVGAGVGSVEFHMENFGGFFDKGAFEIIATAGLVFVSFGGLTATADIAGDVRRAARTVPLGMLSALVVVDSSTVIQPGLAIPHVIVEGEGKFEVLLVRCREGIIFDEKRPPVHTVFFLVGSADERNFHLRALMAVAHIVEQPDFADRWFAAADEEHLRDLILMTIRSRETDETKKRERE